MCPYFSRTCDGTWSCHVGVDRRLQVLFQLRLVERLQGGRVHVFGLLRPPRFRRSRPQEAGSVQTSVLRGLDADHRRHLQVCNALPELGYLLALGRPDAPRGGPVAPAPPAARSSRRAEQQPEGPITDEPLTRPGPCSRASAPQIGYQPDAPSPRSRLNPCLSPPRATRNCHNPCDRATSREAGESRPAGADRLLLARICILASRSRERWRGAGPALAGLSAFSPVK